MKNQLVRVLTLGALAATMAIPATASAQDYRDHRKEVRSQWTGLTIGSALVGIAGLASGNNDLAFAGAVGTAYSAYRLNSDSCEHREYTVVHRVPVIYRDRRHIIRRY